MESRSVNSMESPLAKTTINNLSDAMLCHILSFLPSTKEVVATTTLSRRWYYLWTYVDKVRLDNLSEVHPSDGVPRKMQFAQFVNKVLQLLRASRIKEMQLFCHERGCNEHDITNWITTAMYKNVESLDMAFNDELDLPFFQFNSKTLVTLKIQVTCFSYVCPGRAPCLPSLKTFHLETRRTPTNKWLHSFISGCSALEYLHLDIGRVLDVTTFAISSATLLKIYLRWYLEPVKIALDTPMLKYLSLHGRKIKEFLVETGLSYLSNACISSLIFKSDQALHQNSDPLPRFILSLFNVEVLQCHFQFPKPVRFDLNVPFQNLTILVIRSEFLELKMLRSFMENSNKLQDVHLEKTSSQLRENDIVWVEPKHVPTCLLLSLKKMTIKGIGRLNELDMVEYVLNNAKVLQMMEIHYLSSINEDWQLKFQMIQKITMCVKDMKDVELHFTRLKCVIIHENRMGNLA